MSEHAEKITLYRYDERENSIVPVDAYKIENLIRIRWDEINNIGLYDTEAEAAVARRDRLVHQVEMDRKEYIRASERMSQAALAEYAAKQAYEEASAARDHAADRHRALRNKLEKAEKFVATTMGEALRKTLEHRE